MAFDLRPRKITNYKTLNDGEAVPHISKCSVRQKPHLLEGTYTVERIIWRRQKDREDYQYLVKWKDYHSWDATCEPSESLPDLVIQNFIPSFISPERVQEFANTLERAVQSRLKSRNPSFTVYVDLDIFRHLFGENNSVLCAKHDFDKLNLPDNWYYIIKKDGTGRKLKFPVRLSVRLCFRKMYVKIQEKLVLKQRPVELCNFFTATEACTLSDI